jgi:hypothetical protein
MCLSTAAAPPTFLVCYELTPEDLVASFTAAQLPRNYSETTIVYLQKTTVHYSEHLGGADDD